MIAVQATEDEVAPLIAAQAGPVAVAAVNGPRSVVLSGAHDSVTAVAEHLAAQGRKTHRLTVSHAFHSPLMDPMLEAFRAVVRQLTFHEPRIPAVSTVSGTVVEPGQWTSADYWVEQVRRPVRFLDAVRTLENLNAATLLELGPDGVLTALAAASAGDTGTAAPVATLRAGRAEVRSLFAGVAAAFVRGTPVDWAAVHADGPGRRVPCPPTPSSASATGSTARPPLWLRAPRESTTWQPPRLQLLRPRTPYPWPPRPELRAPTPPPSCWRRSPPCWSTPTSNASTRTPRSRTSASTPSCRSSCATRSPPPPA